MMADELYDSILDRAFVLSDRPRPIPAELRPGWRVYLLLLALSQCHGSRAGMEQLHVLNWAIRSSATRSAFLAFVSEDISPDLVVVRYDPSLSRAIDYAIAEGLVQRARSTSSATASSRSYRLELTELGKLFVEKIFADDSAFRTEKEFLRAIGRKVTDKLIKSLFKHSS